MSKDQISVPRELLERATKDYTGRPMWDALENDRLASVEELRALLAQPNTCTKDGGQCGLGGFCDTCHNVEPVLPRCTCPSGDGSLRWPCPVCPPEPVGWQFLQDGKWWNGDDRIKDHRLNTEAAGYPTRNVFASQPAAQAPVVLPGRADAMMGSHDHQSGWNAYDDEFKRLNPGIAEAAPIRKS